MSNLAVRIFCCLRDDPLTGNIAEPLLYFHSQCTYIQNQSNVIWYREKHPVDIGSCTAVRQTDHSRLQTNLLNALVMYHNA